MSKEDISKKHDEFPDFKEWLENYLQAEEIEPDEITQEFLESDMDLIEFAKHKKDCNK